MAKSVENMEIGHNVGHGQWDWMNDPEIHSSTWEWDMAGLSSQWRYSHNYRHHVFTNVIGMDDDLGFGVMRVTRDQPWQPRYLLQPLRKLLLAVAFEWGIALHGLHAAQDSAETASEKSAQSRAVVKKIGRQMGKDYLVFPALSRPRWRRTLAANAAANVLRNLWAYVVIFCGHFPDGAEKFTAAVVEEETKPEWYLRQMLGTANFDAGPLLAFLSGNLCYQIEHHLFPDLPSNRYAEIATRVRALCDKYDLPYTTGPLRANTCRHCGPSTNWPCRTASWSPPAMTRVTRRQNDVPHRHRRHPGPDGAQSAASRAAHGVTPACPSRPTPPQHVLVIRAKNVKASITVAFP